jgi:hypothetical protein
MFVYRYVLLLMSLVEALVNYIFPAGIFVPDIRARLCVLEMMDSRRQQTGWPVNPLGDELKQFWTRNEAPRPLGQVGMGSPF